MISQPEYQEKISEEETNIVKRKITSKKPMVSSARARNLIYKKEMLRKYYRNTIWGGFYSMSLYGYYCPNPETKPNLIKAIHGSFVLSEWAGPVWSKQRKHYINSKIRKMPLENLPIGKLSATHYIAYPNF